MVHQANKKLSKTKLSKIDNQEGMNNIIEIIKSPKGAGLLIKGVSETIENEVKEKKDGFRDMLLDTLGADLSENLIIRKELNCQKYLDEE